MPSAATASTSWLSTLTSVATAEEFLGRCQGQFQVSAEFVEACRPSVAAIFAEFRGAERLALLTLAAEGFERQAETEESLRRAAHHWGQALAQLDELGRSVSRLQDLIEDVAAVAAAEEHVLADDIGASEQDDDEQDDEELDDEGPLPWRPRLASREEESRSLESQPPPSEVRARRGVIVKSTMVH